MTSELFIGNRAIGNRVQPLQTVLNRKSQSQYAYPPSSHRVAASLPSHDQRSDQVADPHLPQLPDLIDLRQDIMRYTNPLRAKVLLFSLLYRPLQIRSGEETLLLKSHRLDQLLEATLSHYPDYEILAANLKRTTRKLDDPVEYDQVAYAILRSVKPYYSQHRSR